MPEPALPGLIRRLARGATAAAPVGEDDAGLLRRFASDRDEGAFSELVRRHGPMVFDVCRAVLANHADAEDAFQATFLLLARGAGAIRRPGSLAAWLHGVAYRTARKARARAARRRECEARAPAREHAEPDDLSWAEVRLVVHAALAALGERYRAPLVLCYLNGMTQERAAAALGLTQAAVKKRLERGREMLRAALAHRGLGPTAVLAAFAVPAAAVSPALADSAAQAAALFATDPASPALPARVTGLVHGGNSMTPVKLLSALILFPAVAVGFVLAGAPAPDPRAENPPPAVPSPTKEEPAAPGDRKPTELAGGWKVAFVEEGGKSAFPGNELKDARITFKDGAAVVEGFELLFVTNFTFKLDAAKKPREIDVTFTEGEMKGKTFAGIYVVLENEVRVCLRLRNTNLGRPKGFSTVSGTGLYTFFLRPSGDKDEPPSRPRPAGQGAQAPAPARPGAQAPAKTCKVTGMLASSEYAKAGGTIERAIVSVLSDPQRKQLAYSHTLRLPSPTGPEPDFTFDLPPGKYVLECTAVGSRGATFVPTYKEFTVTGKHAALDLGEIDLPASKVTKLFGKPAPELDGVVAWKNTEPLTMKGLKGKVVVLDFWSFSCSICLHHKPDLVKLLEKHGDKGVAVLTVHDGSAETMEDVDRKVPEAVKKKAGHLPVALDRAGDKGVFGSYGITAVPMVILIDAEGRVVRRFHHAGDPELDKEIGRLLKARK